MEVAFSKTGVHLIQPNSVIRLLNSKVVQCLATLSLKMDSILNRLPSSITRWINRHRRQRSLLEFPEELQTEILVRMPVKSILLSQCVCKEFRNIIQNPNFIQTHLTHISHHTPSLFLGFVREYFLLSIDITTMDVLSSRQLTLPPIVYDHFCLVGSCNGLLCFLVWYDIMIPDSDSIFLLWNPVINQSRYLPRSRYVQRFPDVVEFGYDTETNDYLVIKVNRASGFYVEVYKMSIQSWTMIECSTLALAAETIILPQKTSVFLNGSFHWGFNQGDCSYILYYKIKDEKLEVMKGVDDSRVLLSHELNHPHTDHTQWNLAVIDDSLALIFSNDKVINKLEVWVMNEYGVEDSWVIRYQIADDISSCLSPMGYWTNGNLLIIHDMGLHFYDLNTKRRKKIPKVETSMGLTAVCSFVETLVQVKSLV